MAMDELVKVDAQHLQEVLNRLSDRRVAVDREAVILGEPKKGMQDIFRHCRGFERAYSLMLQEANTSFKIRAVVEGGLPETLRRIAIEKRFNRAYVREICREADGYQPHLVSPEKGIRRLVAEAMGLTREHVHRFVDEIHGVLQATVREAARRSVLAESGINPANAPGMEFLRLKGFEHAVVVAADKALEEWKAEAHQVANTMVAMEVDYVTPSFFRELEREFQEGAGGAAGGDDDDAGVGEGPGAPRRGATSADEDDSEDEGDGSGTGTSPAGRGAAISATGPSGRAGQAGGASGAAPAPPPPAPGQDLKAGWLDKRSDKESGGLSSLTGDSFKWQRRWFVVATERGVLGYFKSPEDAQGRGATPRVTINLRSCVVEDVAPAKPAAPGTTPPEALMLRISNRDSTQPVAKAHHALVLRAADAADKSDWMGRLRAAGAGVGTARGGAGAAARAPAPGSQAQGSGQGDAVAPPPQPKGLFGRSQAAVQRFTGLGGSKIASVVEVGAIEDLEAYYERLGQFSGLYARHVYDRMAKTVPKAIILCQVIRSRDRLLDQLYTYLTTLKPVEIDALMQEDQSVIQRRGAVQTAVRELEAAQAEVRRAQEVRATSTSPRPGEGVGISVRALLLAGAFPLVPANYVPRGTDPARLYGEHTPLALAQAEDIKHVRLGAPVKRDAGGAATAASGAPGAAADGQPSSRVAATGAELGDDRSRQPAPNTPGAVSGPGAKPPRRQPPPPPPKLT